MLKVICMSHYSHFILKLNDSMNFPKLKEAFVFTVNQSFMEKACLLFFLTFPISSLSAPGFLSPSVQSTNNSVQAEEMDGVSIFRTREGGQSKSKL